MMTLSQSLWQALLIGATPLTMAAVKGKAQKSKPSKTKPTPRRAKSARTPARPPARAKPTARPAKPSAKKTVTRAPAPPPKPVAPKSATSATTTPVPADAKSPPPTGRAILLSPEGGKFADSINPRFRWLSVGGATRYQVEWSDKPDYTDSHTITSPATDAMVPVEQPLQLGVTYYWRVRGGNESGWGPWSATALFRVLETTE